MLLLVDHRLRCAGSLSAERRCAGGLCLRLGVGVARRAVAVGRLFACLAGGCGPLRVRAGGVAVRILVAARILMGGRGVGMRRGVRIGRRCGARDGRPTEQRRAHSENRYSAAQPSRYCQGPTFRTTVFASHFASSNVSPHGRSTPANQTTVAALAHASLSARGRSAVLVGN